MSIAGHRTTYGRPFGNLDQLKTGDTIDLITPIGACQYRVTRCPFVTEPTELFGDRAAADKSVTLTTCHPKGSAAQRLVVKGTWVKDIKAT